METSHTTIIDGRESSSPYKVSYVSELHPNPRKRPGMEFRSSVRWFHERFSSRRVHQVPFVSRSGKLSVNTLYFWRSYPEQVFMSVVSTVYFRILAILRKRFGRVFRRLQDALIKVATVYVINKDDYIIDRFLGMARKGTPIKSISGFAHYCAIQLDDDKRFVYSQALRRADWLKFQAHGPGDKSSNYMCHRTHIRNLLSESGGQPSLGRLNELKLKLMNFWLSDRPHVSYVDRSRSESLSLDLSPGFQSELLTVDDFFEEDLWL